MKTNAIYALALMLSAAAPLHAVTNIDPNATGNQFGWTENGGWINMEGDGANGVNVGPAFLQGFAWHENFGWINLGDGTPANTISYSNSSAADFGVNTDPSGNLTGFAWGENIGWITFDTTGSGGSQVVINPTTGNFTGFAWCENVGWLAFDTVAPADVAQTITNSPVTDWNLY